MERKEHWESLYERRQADDVTWFQPKLAVSLKHINNLNIDKDSSLVDIGAGASTLPDTLLEQGFSDITLVDISANAFVQSKARLGENAEKPKWIVSDITEFKSEKKFKLWHDRAVFHFLVDVEERKKYRENLLHATDVGSFFIVSTFAEDGPLKCSNLEIVRYAKEELVEFFRDNFKLLDFEKELHTSPGGMEQKFNYWVFERIS